MRGRGHAFVPSAVEEAPLAADRGCGRGVRVGGGKCSACNNIHMFG